MVKILDYATPYRRPQTRAEVARLVMTVGGLTLSLYWLVESQFVLASAGLLVGHYLRIVPAAIPALGWSQRVWMKIVAAMLILLAVYLAYADHTAGQIRQAQILKLKYGGSAATMPATAPFSGTPTSRPADP